MDCSTPGFPVHQQHKFGACSNSCPSSQWCHSTISSSVEPSSSCLQPFPASGSFQMSQFLASSGQSIGVSASASVLPMNIHDWFPLGLTTASTHLFFVCLIYLFTYNFYLPGRSLVAQIPWRRKWQPTPVFLPGESHGLRSLAGASAKSRTWPSDFTFTFNFYFILGYSLFMMC